MYLQCLASGVCGPGFGGVGGCHPQIQPLQGTCQPPCGPGLKCSPYGCVQAYGMQLRARARGANVFRPEMEDDELKVSLGRRKFFETNLRLCYFKFIERMKISTKRRSKFILISN